MKTLYSRALTWLFWLVCCWPGALWGHAQLVNQQPQHQSSLSSVPDAVTLNFNEPVTPIFVRLIDQTGTLVRLDESPVSRGQSVIQPLPGTLADGNYVVSWRVISADSHPVGGSFQFQLGTLASSATAGAELLLAATESTSIWADFLHRTNRTLLLLSMLALAGGLWFPLHHHGLQRQPEARQAIQRWLIRLTWVVMATATVQVLLLGWRIGGGQMSAQEWWAAMDIARSTTLGRSSLIAGSAALLLCGLLTRLSAAQRHDQQRHDHGMTWLARATALLMLSSLASTGHTLTHPQAGWLALLLVAHVVLAAYWLGAMPVLWRLSFHGSTQTLGHWLAQFSRHAVWLVMVLLVLGVALAASHLGTIEALNSSSYGQVLWVKVALIGMALALALVNQRYITRALKRNRHTTRLWLRITLAVESTLLVAVIASTAVLSSTMPPHSNGGHNHSHDHDHGPSGQPAQWIVTSGAYRLTLDMAHTHPDANQWVAAFSHQDSAFTPMEVEVAVSLPALDIEPRWERFTALGELFILDTSNIALPGEWTLQVNALVNDFEQVSFTLTVPITAR